MGQNDRGPASPNLAMTDLILVLRRGPEQQAAFDQFVASQYDASSPNFHSWLAPADVGRMFGPSLADIATISSWLAGHGLRVDEVSPDRMTIRFSGAAAQVESAFHVEIHNLLVNGQPHIANMSDPQIPAALAPVVAGVKALHNFFPRPLHQTGGLVSLDASGAGWRRVPGSAQQDAAATLAAQPEFGISVGSGSSAYTIEDVAPYDFATIYNVLPLWNSGIDGSGQTIAIAGTSDINTADVASFRSVFGLPAGTAPKTIVANGIDPGECMSTSSGSSARSTISSKTRSMWNGREQWPKGLHRAGGVRLEFRHYRYGVFLGGLRRPECDGEYSERELRRMRAGRGDQRKRGVQQSVGDSGSRRYWGICRIGRLRSGDLRPGAAAILRIPHNMACPSAALPPLRTTRRWGNGLELGFDRFSILGRKQQPRQRFQCTGVCARGAVERYVHESTGPELSAAVGDCPQSERLLGSFAL